MIFINPVVTASFHHTEHISCKITVIWKLQL